jgi:hypothetical protein
LGPLEEAVSYQPSAISSYERNADSYEFLKKRIPSFGQEPKSLWGSWPVHHSLIETQTSSLTVAWP